MRTERRILNRALAAACEASVDAGEHTYTTRCIGKLNEQWVQSYVGIAINDELRNLYHEAKDRSFVSFETSVAWLEGFISEERGVGRIPGALRPRQRFDITVWSKGGGVAGLVEIKDQPVIQAHTLEADPAKLCGALRRWPSLRWGMFMFSVRSTGTSRFQTAREELQAKAQTFLSAIQAGSGCEIIAREPCDHVLRRRDGKILWCGVMFRALN